MYIFIKDQKHQLNFTLPTTEGLRVRAKLRRRGLDCSGEDVHLRDRHVISEELIRTVITLSAADGPSQETLFSLK